MAFLHIKGAYKRNGESLFTRTRGNSSKLQEGRQIRYKEEFFYDAGGEALEQVAQRSCGHPLPGSVQDQVGWGFQQPTLVKDVPAHGRGM